MRNTLDRPGHPSPSNLTSARLVRSRTVLTPASGFLYAFTHTLNPYMGCAWGAGGCGIYCYVAESPIGLYARQPWGQWLNAKANAAEALRTDLASIKDRGAVRVFMSSATDPYQPLERKLHISRAILEVFRELPVGLLVVQTRSPFVEKDFDLLADMPFAWLSMTVETDDDAVRRSLTPTCPSIERRLGVMRRARDVGIRVQAAVSPTFPHDPPRFAELLVGAAYRVIVDTFFGDGSGGKRTGRRPLPQRFAQLGYGNWRDISRARLLFDALTERIGPDRVGWSQEGFNALAVLAAARVSPSPVQSERKSTVSRTAGRPVDCVRLWFALELAHATTYSVVPGWIQPWLEELGFSDSTTQAIHPEAAAQTCRD